MANDFQLGQLGQYVTVNTTANSVTVNSNVTLGNNAVTPFTGIKNRLINGDMRIWQRGTSFSNANSTLSTQYTADRWRYNRGNFAANCSATQVTGLTINGVNRNALRIQRTANDANTQFLLCGQSIETLNIQDLAGQQITISAHVRMGANFSNTNLAMYVSFGSGTDESPFSYTNANTPGGLNIAANTTYARYSTTVTAPSNANEATFWFQYYPSGTAGANDWFEITDVQLEAGPVATPFERRSYGQELALCQRYYEGPIYVASGGVTASGIGIYGTAYYAVTKRATPSISVSTPTLIGSATGMGLSVAYYNGFEWVITNGAGGSAIGRANFFAAIEL